MPRDYASKSASKGGSRKRRSRHGVSGWAWLAGAIFVGLFVAFLVYLSHQPRSHIAFNPKELLPAPKGMHDTRDVRKNKAQAPPGPPPASTDNHKPHFDFYTILPDMEVEVPDKELQASAAKPGQANPDTNATFVLQVGAFRRQADAESLKAKIALKAGLQANVQTVTIGQQTWHRVRLGPYHGLAALNRARDKLRQGDVPAIVLKIKS